MSYARIYRFIIKIRNILPIYSYNYPYFIDVFIVLTLSYFLINSWDMNIKLTKKEKDFLISWLSDDLDLAIENKQTSSNYLINKLKSILKKLTKEQ